MDCSILKTLRKSKKITLKEMSKKIGVSGAYISMIEQNKKNPSISIIEDICRELGNIELLLIIKSNHYKDGDNS